MEHVGRTEERQCTPVQTSPLVPGADGESPELDYPEPQAMVGYLTIEMDVSELRTSVTDAKTPESTAAREGLHREASGSETVDGTDRMADDSCGKVPDGLGRETVPEYVTIEIEEDPAGALASYRGRGPGQ